MLRLNLLDNRGLAYQALRLTRELLEDPVQPLTWKVVKVGYIDTKKKRTSQAVKLQLVLTEGATILKVDREIITHAQLVDQEGKRLTSIANAKNKILAARRRRG